MDPVTMLANIAQAVQMVASMGERAKVQRSNCQNLMGRIKLLKPLLDEVRESKMSLSGGLASFDSLENAISKAKELLDKCGGRGSVLYMALRSQAVMSKFQDVTLEIDRSLNSLPFVSLRVSDRIRSQVELITRELRRTKYCVDASDERLAEEIEALLREQREGLRPSHEALRKLADRLDLRSSEAVADETQALEKEREEACTEKDMFKQELLNQLLLLVEQIAETIGDQKSGGLEIPSDFRCPLSLELMSDPVIVASGQTYEKTYIQQWLDQGNTRCPKTRQILSHANLIPNYTVKALIAYWCEENNVPLPGPMKLDALENLQRPISPVLSSKVDTEPNDRITAPLASVHETSTVATVTLERSVSAVGSRPLVKSKRTIRPKSYDTVDLDRVPTSGHSGEEQGEPSQAARTASADSEAELSGGSLRCGSNLAVDIALQQTCTALGSMGVSSVDDGHLPAEAGPPVDGSQATTDQYPYSGELSGELERTPVSAAGNPAFSEEPGSPARPPERSVFMRRGEERDISLPRIVNAPVSDSLGTDGSAQIEVDGLVEDLQSPSVDVQRAAAAELRLLARYNMENRITIANSGAIRPLVGLLMSGDPKTQENAVTALLNLSINDNNKAEIAAAGAIEPLVNVLRVGNSDAMENAAATLFSLSVMDDNKVSIGASGAIPPLVHLLINGTPRGKKDAATALFNLSIFHENKGRIVRAGAIQPLVELMAEPAAGMVDKAVAVLANLATIPEGRVAIGEEGGIPALVEVVEAGSQRGKENAAAALLQMCMNSNRHRAMVLQEGAIPPLVALSQTGTARAKEKASALLRHFREQRHAVLGGRTNPDRHMGGHF